jgi:hypothetical protein
VEDGVAGEGPVREILEHREDVFGAHNLDAGEEGLAFFGVAPGRRPVREQLIAIQPDPGTGARV